MSQPTTCPALADFLNADQCTENIAGTSAVVYVFVKSDLSAPLTRTDNTYATPEFKSGKGLYKIDVKDGTQQIKGESQGNNKGFNLTYNNVIDKVNKELSKLSRALNNLDLGFIVPDGENETQIMYDPNHRVKFDTGGIASDTGAATSDDRQTTLEAKLEGVLYDNLYVEAPEEGWDSLLASKAAAA